MIAASSSGEIWIVPGGGLGGPCGMFPVPYSRITFWNASGYWEINYDYKDKYSVKLWGGLWNLLENWA